MTYKEIEGILKEKGVKYEIKPEEKRGSVEFWTSTAGQDIPVEFDFDGTPKDFIEQFANRADLYDVDEEVALFTSMLGKNGIPATVKELIDDCQEAKDKLMDIAAALMKLINPEVAKKYKKSVQTGITAADMDAEYA